MNPHFSLFGLNFYWYGLIVGLAIAVVLILVDYRAQLYDRLQFSDKKKQVKSRTVSLQLFFQQWSVVLVIGGFVGARLWHVATDWQLYRFNWQGIFQISQGGLSILGAMAGVALTLLLVRRFSKTARAVPVLLIADAIVFGLPFGQAIGRLGNWVNQELYGLPSALPWAITISPEHRMAGYEAIARYHPLFFYEALAMVVLGGLIWWLNRTRPRLFGTGFFVLLYITIYSIVRFCLDFLRLGRPVWFVGLSANQMILLAVFVVSLALWLKSRKKHEKN